MCHSGDELDAILQRWTDEGVGNILALSGDLPRDKPDWDRAQDACRYAADLITYIKAFTDKHGHPDARGFGIGVAGFPEGHTATPNRMLEMDRLKAKVDAGADYICTQMFFRQPRLRGLPRALRAGGDRHPDPGGHHADHVGQGHAADGRDGRGLPLPRGAAAALARAGDDEAAVRRVGVHWATEQCRQLLDAGVAGLHFYTLNKSDATRQIYQNLGVADSAGLGGG